VTFSGWIILVLSVATVTALFAGCLYKVLTSPVEAERMRGIGAETPDLREEEDRDG
jgi:hypothetical protein